MQQTTLRPLHTRPQQPTGRRVHHAEERKSYQGQQAHHLRINQPSLLCDMPPVQRILHWRVQNIKSKDEPSSEPLEPWQHNGTSTQSQPTPEDLCRWLLLGVPISRRQHQPPNYT